MTIFALIGVAPRNEACTRHILHSGILYAKAGCLRISNPSIPRLSTVLLYRLVDIWPSIRAHGSVTQI